CQQQQQFLSGISPNRLADQYQSMTLKFLCFRKVCVHCKCDKTEHELPPNQAGSVYERLGIKPPANMPISSSRDDAPGSVSHGYSWVPPGLTRKKVSTVIICPHRRSFKCTIFEMGLSLTSV
ncbi:hypothetical protein GCK32_022311, partial [Trichostrongylus colubriformis]